MILLTARDDGEGYSWHGASAGFLTARGGATSHAAVVARGMGKCCITGAKDIHLDEDGKAVRIGGKIFHSGDWLSLEGSTGRVFAGRLPVKAGEQ